MNYSKIVTCKELNQSEKIMLVYMATKGVDNVVSISVRILCRELSMSSVTVIKTLKSLCDKGIMSKQSNHGINGGTLSNTYKITTDRFII